MLQYFESTYLVKGNGMFPKRRILAPEQDSEGDKIRSEGSHGRRTERSRGNVPLPWSELFGIRA